MSDTSLDALRRDLQSFVVERDWGQFHDPKNLAMAVVSEAGELAALYRWQANTDADRWTQIPENLARASVEAADVGISLLLFCERAGIDLITAMQRKLALNRLNYPADRARGMAERPAQEG